MRSVILLLLATFVIADLSPECQYVNSTRFLTDNAKVEKCFDTFTLHQDVLDRIIQNLEIIHDFYPYTDIAMNPPEQPAAYFKKINFTSAIEDLKQKFAESGRVVSKVFRPAMALVNGFHDNHFNLVAVPVSGEYENIFASVSCFFPFKWDATVEGMTRKVFIHSPNSRYLSPEACDTINSLYNDGIYVRSVDNEDPFDFFSKFFGDYSTQKSPQATLVEAKRLEQGFSLLQYPLDNIFDQHVITFSNDGEVAFNVSFGNSIVPPPPPGREGNSQEYELPSLLPQGFVSMEREKEIIEAIKNFKPRSVRQQHEILDCDTFLNTQMPMNYIQIPTFDPPGGANDLFLQELVECVALFDTNSYPITIILPHNGGGSLNLMMLTQFLLMPTSDFRTTYAIRKSERSRHIAVDGGYFNTNTDDMDTCDSFASKSDIEKFWKKTVTDDFGDGVTHQRSEKVLEDSKSWFAAVGEYRMTKNIRKPTHVIVATDGYCFSACALFVYNVARAGSAILAGFGLTNPGGDIFSVGQCPSAVTVVSDYFDEVKNNTDYGLYFRGTTLESYSGSDLSEKIPGDYSVYLTDTHTGYYDSFDRNNYTQVLNLLNKTFDVVVDFMSTCNPRNKKLLLIDGSCKPKKPHVFTGGYACGDNGEWDGSHCKVAICEEGYVVDFKNDECVPNPCDLRYTVSSSEKSSSAKISSEKSSAHSVTSSLATILTFISLAFITPLHHVFMW